MCMHMRKVLLYTIYFGQNISSSSVSVQLVRKFWTANKVDDGIKFED